MVKIDEKELTTLITHAMLWMLNDPYFYTPADDNTRHLIGGDEAEATIRKWEKWKQARKG